MSTHISSRISGGALSLLLAAPLSFASVALPAHAADTTAIPAGAVVINEVEFNGDDTDWVELYNTTSDTIDLSGFVFRDNSDDADHLYTLPEGSVIEPGGFFVIDQKSTHDDGFDYGLGGNDAARLYTPDGTLYASYEWTSPADVTYGACPDGSGELVQTAVSTKGVANNCTTSTPTASDATPCPGGQTVTDLDSVNESRGDWSGLDYVPSGSSAVGSMWAVQNGDGQLYKLENTNGSWATSEGWTLHYPDGSGTVDAEGVTVADDGFVYVSTERDNSNKSVSRPSVLKFAPTNGTADSSTELNAMTEWNLADDFPDLGANSGLEAITWIPDSWLTSNGLVDQNTGAKYDPETYEGHGNGLFAVGVEGTAGVYLYALQDDGTAVQVSSFESGFELVADLEFDAERNQLWVVCDEACDGEITTFTLGSSGSFEKTAVYARPSETQNYANEGFTIADKAQCTNGAVPVYYAADANTDGHSLREGTLTTECDTSAEPTVAPVDPTVEPTVAPSESTSPTVEPSADSTSSVEPSASASAEPTTSAEPSESADPSTSIEPSASETTAEEVAEPSAEATSPEAESSSSASAQALVMTGQDGVSGGAADSADQQIGSNQRYAADTSTPSGLAYTGASAIVSTGLLALTSLLIGTLLLARRKKA